MKLSLHLYTTVHEKSCIHRDGKIYYHYICEDPEFNKFATIHGLVNIDRLIALNEPVCKYLEFNKFISAKSFKDPEDMHSGNYHVLEIHDVNFYNSKQEALNHSRKWESKFTDIQFDILSHAKTINHIVEGCISEALSLSSEP
jgi:hypothetical protein